MGAPASASETPSCRLKIRTDESLDGLDPGQTDKSLIMLEILHDACIMVASAWPIVDGHTLLDILLLQSFW